MLLVLSMGAHYAPDDEVLRKFPSFQLKTFRALSMKKIEDNLHTLYDAAELESVQVCALLGSWYGGFPCSLKDRAVIGIVIETALSSSVHANGDWQCTMVAQTLHS